MLTETHDKFLLKDYNDETQRYMCQKCGWLYTIQDIQDIKPQPDHDGYYLIQCKNCNSIQKMRIIYPSPWAKKINTEMDDLVTQMGVATRGTFIGSKSQFDAALAAGQIAQGTMIVLTSLL